MRPILSIFFGTLLLFSCSLKNSNKENTIDDKLIEHIIAQEKYALDVIQTTQKPERRIYPRSLEENGEVRWASARDWTSGFYPGILWILYEISSDEQWKDQAIKYTELLENEQYNDSNHDIGFKMMSSYGNGYRLTKNEAYREILIQSARTLITRFNEKVGCIRSWDHHKDKWDYPVIIDNMINLELLFWASRETGDPVFTNIAIKHAETTLLNHFRNDFSTYHVVSYDTLTGEVAKKQTRQGYSHESSWARGQAWALYGYTMTYRETQDPQFLAQAEKVANYIFNIAVLPEDNIPFWDFNAPEIPKEPRDVSAAAVIASALYELSTFSSKHQRLYVGYADKIIQALSSEEYFNQQGTKSGFLLRHSTGSKPMGSEIDVPLIYADYYFLEALLRKMKIDNKQINN